MRLVKAVALRLMLLLAGLIIIGAVLMEMSLHVRPAVGKAPADAPRVVAIDGVTLRGVVNGSGNRGCVLLLHGISDTHLGMSGFSDMLVAAGYRTLAPDSRGHGWSDGPLVTYGVLESRDVSTWVDWLRAQGCTRVFGLGESLGGSVLLQSLSRERRFRAVIADSAYLSFPAIALDRLNRVLPFPVWFDDALTAPAVAGGLLYARLRYGLNLRETSAMDALRKTQTPVLLIDGMKDTRTPVAHSRRMARANREIELWEVANAGHCGAFGAEPIQFQTRVLAWFR